MPFRPISVAVVRTRPNDYPAAPLPPPVDAPRTIVDRNGLMFSLGNLDRRAAMFCKTICRGFERIFRGSNLRHEEFRCRTALLDAGIIPYEEFRTEGSKLLARAMSNLYHQKYGEVFTNSAAVASDAHYLASKAAAEVVVAALRRVPRPGMTPHLSAWLTFNLRSLSEPRPPMFY